MHTWESLNHSFNVLIAERHKSVISCTELFNSFVLHIGNIFLDVISKLGSFFLALHPLGIDSGSGFTALVNGSKCGIRKSFAKLLGAVVHFLRYFGNLFQSQVQLIYSRYGIGAVNDYKHSHNADENSSRSCGNTVNQPFYLRLCAVFNDKTAHSPEDTGFKADIPLEIKMLVRIIPPDIVEYHLHGNAHKKLKRRTYKRRTDEHKYRDIHERVEQYGYYQHTEAVYGAYGHT